MRVESTRLRFRKEGDMPRTAFLPSASFAMVLALGAVGAAERPAAGTSPTFTKDVAPILYNSCVGCHREGEIAPMALVSYQDARPWAKAIKSRVVAREMPPWGADPHYGKFNDDRSLTQQQIDIIAAWVDAGAPKGDDADLPRLPTFATGWSHGEPDAVIEMPIDFEIPAEGEVAVTDFFVQAPFKTDVYVKALEVRPGTAGVVHHAGVYVIDRLPAGSKYVNGQIVGADGKPMARNQIARANGGSATEEIQKLLSYVPGRGYETYQGDAAPPSARQEHEVHADMARRPRGSAARRPQIRLQLAGLLRAGDAEADSGGQQGDRRDAVRQLREESVQPGAREGSVLVRAELG